MRGETLQIIIGDVYQESDFMKIIVYAKNADKFVQKFH